MTALSPCRNKTPDTLSPSAHSVSLSRGIALATAAAVLLPAVAAFLFAGTAHAQDTATVNIGGYRGAATTVTMQPTDAPGAVAEIIFADRLVNNPDDAGGYTVTLGDMTAEIAFGFNTAPGGQDSITVTPPAGFIAVPETLTLMEGATGVILLYSEGLS